MKKREASELLSILGTFQWPNIRADEKRARDKFARALLARGYGNSSNLSTVPDPYLSLIVVVLGLEVAMRRAYLGSAIFQQNFSITLQIFVLCPFLANLASPATLNSISRA